MVGKVAGRVRGENAELICTAFAKDTAGRVNTESVIGWRWNPRGSGTSGLCTFLCVSPRDNLEEGRVVAVVGWVIVPP